MNVRVVVLLVLCLIFACYVATNAGQRYADVPLPADLKISGLLPSSITDRAWSQRWSSSSPYCSPSEGLNAILIFESIRGNRADIIYAVGNSPEWGIKPSWQRYRNVELEFDGSIINFAFTSKLTSHTFKWKLEGGKLSGSIYGRNVDVEMTPCKALGF